MRQLVLQRPGRARVMPVQHLSATEIAGFIDSTLSPDARTAAELHLSGCAQCREELASCLRLSTTAPSRSSSRVGWPLLASIAAAILIMVVLRPGQQRTMVDRTRERATVTTASSLAVAPADGESIERRDLQFVWRRDPAAVSYHVVVTDSAGGPAWRSDDLTDTSTRPSPIARLSSGARYYWRVDALHADGSSAQSPTAGFRITH